MTPKEYLEQVRKIDRKITLLEEKYEEIHSSLYGRAIVYTSDGAKKSSHDNSMENALICVLEIEEKMKNEIKNLIKCRIDVEKSIHTLIDDPLVQEIFERKYLLFQTWEQISLKLNYSVVHLHRLHSANISAFSSVSSNLSELQSVS